MKHYETLGGKVTRSETSAKLLELLREAESCCYTIAHLHKTEDSSRDNLMATGWRGIGEMLKLVRNQIIKLETGKLLKN